MVVYYPGEALVTAHNNDEQVESLFINLKRGSGPFGLSPMANVSYFKRSFLLRPLLQFSKYQLKTYADCFRLSWVEDESNNDVRFERSFLRLNILPTLKARWVKLSCSVSRSISSFFEQIYLINELLSNTLLRLVNYDGSLGLLPLFSMDVIKRYAIIRRWLIKYDSQMPSKRKILYIWNHIINCRSDANPSLIHDNKLICRLHNKLYLITKNSFSSFDEVSITWFSLETPLILPKRLGILGCYSLNLVINLKRPKTSSYAVKRLVVSNISIETPSFYETLSIAFGYNNKGFLSYLSSLKFLCQKLETLFWGRKRLSLLFFGNVYMAAIGFYTYKPNKSNRCLVYWYII